MHRPIARKGVAAMRTIARANGIRAHESSPDVKASGALVSSATASTSGSRLRKDASAAVRKRATVIGNGPIGRVRR